MKTSRAVAVSFESELLCEEGVEKHLPLHNSGQFSFAHIHIYISAHQQCFILNCKCSPQSKYFDVGRRTPITPTALCWLAVRCWYVCKPQHGRLLGVALYGCSCLDCTSWHFSVSMSSFPLPHTHTHPTRLTHHACKHGHACCLHPVSVLLLIGVCLVIFLYLLIFSHPRKRILFFSLSIFGGKASE